MPHQMITISAPDGECPTGLFTPTTGSGPWPGVIFFMDALAIRPAMRQMAQQVADLGYVVALPDLYYRLGPREELVPAQVMSANPAEVLGPLMASTDTRRAAHDVAGILDLFTEREDVAGAAVGTTGYCMGGALALAAAAVYPDRVAAAASFHGAGLATDAELSVHRIVDQIGGAVYVGAANNDPFYPPAMAGRLCAALMEGDIDHEHVFYANAAHGFAVPDVPAFNEAAAIRHWQALERFFAAHL